MSRSDFWVELSGRQDDLADVAAMFESGDPRVEKRGDSVVLVSAAFDGVEDDHELHRLAEPLVSQMNQAARLHDPGIGLLEANRVSFHNTATGQRNSSVWVTARADLRVRMRGILTVVPVDGRTIQPQQSDVSKMLRAAQADADAADVLEHISSAVLDGATLGKVYEVVREDFRRLLSGEGLTSPREGEVHRRIEAEGIVKRAELERFKASIQHQAAVGAASRHARLPGPPPTNAMDHHQAIGFGRELARKYLLWKHRRIVGVSGGCNSFK